MRPPTTLSFALAHPDLYVLYKNRKKYTTCIGYRVSVGKWSGCFVTIVGLLVDGHMIKGHLYENLHISNVRNFHTTHRYIHTHVILTLQYTVNQILTSRNLSSNLCPSLSRPILSFWYLCSSLNPAMISLSTSLTSSPLPSSSSKSKRV